MVRKRRLVVLERDYTRCKGIDKRKKSVLVLQWVRIRSSDDI